jgi:hypothetical protein
MTCITPDGVGTEFPEPNEISIRIEDHHSQIGHCQQLLEDHAERIGLARPALPAEERVPVKGVCEKKRREFAGSRRSDAGHGAPARDESIQYSGVGPVDSGAAERSRVGRRKSTVLELSQYDAGAAHVSAFGALFCHDLNEQRALPVGPESQ